MRRSDAAVYVLASGRHPGVVKLSRTTRGAAVWVDELTRAPGYRVLLTGFAGLVSGALGAAILVSIDRARFRHRNPYGQLMFRSYGRWLVFRGATGVLRPLGTLLLFNGAVLLLAVLNAPPEAWYAGTPAPPAGWKAAAHD